MINKTQDVLKRSIPLLADKDFKACEISGSHGGKHENGCLLGCCAV
jgi:hypothetical protein